MSLCRKCEAGLTEFEGRTVSCGPSFFPFAYGPSAKRAGYKLTGKNEDPLLTVRAEKTRFVRYLSYDSLV